MTRKFESDGDTIQYTNSSGSTIASGSIVKMQNILGVALVDIADGSSGSVAVEGVFSGIPKVSGAVFVKGEKLIYDVSASAFDDSAATPASGDVTGAAVAWVAGANLETECTIKLTPGNSTVT
jgi:predicted RecA/RadA family phage recombinase